MSDTRHVGSRREFLGGLTLMGTAGMPGLRAWLVTVEPPPETRGIRLHRDSWDLHCPQTAEELLYLEGFTEAPYVAPGPRKITFKRDQQLAAGALGISMALSAPSILQVDAGIPIVLLGCMSAATKRPGPSGCGPFGI